MYILAIPTRAFQKPVFSLFLLALVISVTFSGCGGSSDTTVSDPKTTQTEITQTKQPVTLQIKDEGNKTLKPAFEEYTVKDPLFPRQWHLQKREKCDINVTEVWKKYRGRGVKIAVVDTGIEAKHPDLHTNVDMNLSKCYENGSSDPSPTIDELNNPFIDVTHGTAVAGIIAALQNEIGVSGVAPEVTLVGLNVFSNPEDSVFEDAMLYRGVDISSNSWGNDLRNGLDDDRVVLDAIVQKMESDPIVYLFASGNEASNTNFSSVLNSRYTFPVGAVTIEGKAAHYSNYGANLLTIAPGGGGLFGDRKIVTTDLTTPDFGYDSYKNEHFDVKGNENFNYTDQMNGTSAAAPIVSGVVALMLEANPKLGYREIRDIIVKTSTKVDKMHTSWQKNGAGFWFSPYYGFGLINAGKAVAMAQKQKPLPAESVLRKTKKTLHIAIADNDDSGIAVPLDVTEDMVIEYVEVTIKTDHSYSGDLRIVLHSPSGTSSILAYGRTLTDDYYLPWTFASLQFYGESAEGKWELSVADLAAKNSGELDEVTLTLYGHKR